MSAERHLYHRLVESHAYKNALRKKDKAIRSLVPVFLALASIGAVQSAQAQQSEQPRHPQACSLPEGDTLAVDMRAQNYTCINALTLATREKVSFLEHRGSGRSSRMLIGLVQDAKGNVVQKHILPLKSPGFSLPSRIDVTTATGSSVSCSLKPDEHYTCESTIPEHAPVYPTRPARATTQATPAAAFAPRAETSPAAQKPSEAQPISDNECINSWGTRVRKGVEENGYTCTWSESHLGLEYNNFTSNGVDMFVIFNPNTNSFWWDYGKVDQTTFKPTLGESPSSSNSTTHVDSFADMVSNFLTSLFSGTNTSVDSSSPDCIQNPLSNMGVGQEFGLTDFVRSYPEWYVKTGGIHSGVDLHTYDTTYRQPIRPAFCSGTVIEVENHPNQCGSCSVLLQTGPYTTLYFHMACPTNMQVGNTVDATTVLGNIGPGDSCSTGPHLHFELHKNNQLVDPLTLFPFR